MRVFVAGGAGAIGRLLVPLLVADGHEVRGTTRSPARASWLRAAGAQPVLLDVYDPSAVAAALAEARPEVVIHQLTDLAHGFGPDDLAANARLRTLGTRHLVDGARAAGVRRIVAQSGAWLYAEGPAPHVEDDPLREPSPDDATLHGILELERLVLASPPIEGVVLRYGYLYGPGTAGEQPGPPPTVHVSAAARAAALAVDRGPAGVYNIVDDGQTVSNGKARELLGWEP